MKTSAEEIKALPTAHFVDWLKRYAGSLRYGDPPTNGNDIAFLEVARRLSEMDAENKMLREACLQAALTFRFYEQSHLAKKTQDGDEKAHRNHEMAAMCEAALEHQP